MRRISRWALLGARADANIPALLRKGALEALGGQLDIERDISPTRKYGVRVPLRVNGAVHYVLSVVEFGKGPPRIDRGQTWQLRILSGRLRISDRIYRTEAYICPSRRLGFLVLSLPKTFQPVWQRPWEMRRMIVSRIPRSSSRSCVLIRRMARRTS